MAVLSQIIVPLVMALVGIGMVVSKKDLFSAFTDGAKDGMKTAFSLLPTLVVLLSAIAMFNGSGASVALAKFLSPLGEKIGIPSEIIPLVLVRPLSGGASTALITDIFEKYGPDSFAGRCASVIAGSSDTLLYVISVYFGAVGVKKTRGSVPISFFVMVFCVFLSVLMCRIVFI
ncbi:MAG: spore maturation protein [Ruminococcaceae bacterium]|nr:spore maturation protein [Oscillospiraceae bacterium]